MARVAVLVMGLLGLYLMGQASAFTPCVGDASVAIGNGQCFSLYTKETTPWHAIFKCWFLFPSKPWLPPKSFLATVHSDDENRALQQLLKNNCADALIGFVRVFKYVGVWVENPLQWVTTSSCHTNFAREYNDQMCKCGFTFTSLSRSDGKWRPNCGAAMPYVCTTPQIDPCRPPYSSPGWTNVNNRCFKLLEDKERKGAEYICKGLEPEGKSVMYDFDDEPEFVKSVLTELEVLPTSNQQKTFWLDVHPIYDNKYGPNYYDNNNNNNHGRYKRHYDDDGPRDYDRFKGYDRDYHHHDKGYDKGYDKKKGYYYSKPKCLAGIAKGTNPLKFFVEKENCENEYNVICELKVLPPEWKFGKYGKFSSGGGLSTDRLSSESAITTAAVVDNSVDTGPPNLFEDTVQNVDQSQTIVTGMVNTVSTNPDAVAAESSEAAKATSASAGSTGA